MSKIGTGNAMTVLFIAYAFPPVRHSGTIRSEAFAHYLPDFGIFPVVLSATDAAATAHSRKMGHHISLDWRDDERWPPVRRVPWGRNGQRARIRTDGFLRRLPLGATYAARSGRRALCERVLPTAREAIRSENPVAIYATFSTVESVLIADRLGQEFCLPVVVDFRDQWSYQSAAPYRHYVDFLLERRLERQVLQRAARIITTTQTAADLLVSELEVEQSKITVIPNGYDERDFKTLDNVSNLKSGKFVVVYTGEMGRGVRGRSAKTTLKQALGFDYWPLSTNQAARSPAAFLQAAHALLNRRPQLRDVLRVWLVGQNADSIRPELAAFGYPECVRVLGRVSTTEAARICSGANLLLLLQNEYFLRGQDYSVAIPAKLYTYLRTGRRILAVVQPSEIATTVVETGAGVVTPPRDVPAIEEALEAEIDRWQSGQVMPSVPHKTIECWDRRRLTAELASLIRSAVARGGEQVPLTPQSLDRDQERSPRGQRPADPLGNCTSERTGDCVSATTRRPSRAHTSRGQTRSCRKPLWTPFVSRCCG